jgi:hypothetical protein
LFGEHDLEEVNLRIVVTCGVERFSEGLDAVAGIAELTGIGVDELAEKGGMRGEQPRGCPAITPCCDALGAQSTPPGAPRTPSKNAAQATGCA